MPCAKLGDVRLLSERAFIIDWVLLCFNRVLRRTQFRLPPPCKAHRQRVAEHATRIHRGIYAVGARRSPAVRSAPARGFAFPADYLIATLAFCRSLRCAMRRRATRAAASGGDKHIPRLPPLGARSARGARVFYGETLLGRVCNCRTLSVSFFDYEPIDRFGNNGDSGIGRLP